MLPTFVIGLREGVEAALIVGIIAAFLGRSAATRSADVGWRRDRDRDLRRRRRRARDREPDLPQRQQEGLETVVGLIAVGMVTFMIVWMRRNARGLQASAREPSAASALARGSVLALVAMAFFAVLREGFETAVFLLAAFDASTSPVAAGAGRCSGSSWPW